VWSSSDTGSPVKGYVTGGLIGAAVTALIVWPENQPPITLISAEIIESCTIDGVVKPKCVSGERMRIAYEAHWNETCPMFVDIFIFKAMKDTRDQEVVFRNGPIRAAFEEGKQKWVREVFIPPFLENGDYIYRARLTGPRAGGHAADSLLAEPRHAVSRGRAGAAGPLLPAAPVEAEVPHRAVGVGRAGVPASGPGPAQERIAHLLRAGDALARAVAQRGQRQHRPRARAGGAGGAARVVATGAGAVAHAVIAT